MLDRRSEPYGFGYTRKDLILYALAIGMGSEDGSVDDDLRFLYEHHAEFSSLPVFCLTLTFWANQVVENNNPTSARIPIFPPPLMTRDQLIPKELLLSHDDVDLSQYPVIHTWQSIVWETNLPIPSQNEDDFIRTFINLQTIAVQPKSVGAFVTTESQVTALDPVTKQHTLICTLQSTALVYGISKDIVSSYNTESIPSTPFTKNSQWHQDTPPILEWTYPTLPNSALLYRIASGDSNHIHVDHSVSEQMGSPTKAPLLHGLLSLAIAFRGILKVVPDADCRIRRLEAQFSQPAFVGDVLLVRIWRGSEQDQFWFQISNSTMGAVLVDGGYAELGEPRPSRTTTTTTRSRL